MLRMTFRNSKQNGQVLKQLKKTTETKKEKTMVRKDSVTLAVGGALLIALIYIFVTRAKDIPVDVFWVIIMTTILLVFFGMVFGWSFARNDFLGKAMETDEISEGDYPCYRIADKIFWIINRDNEEKRIFQIRLPFDVGPPMDEPGEKKFNLLVSQETGYRCVESGPPKLFSRRRYTATWKDKKGEICTFVWTSDDRVKQ